MASDLTAANAVEYLVSRRLIDRAQAGAATATELGGGVSNTVVRVDMRGTGCGLVLKQSLPRLAGRSGVARRPLAHPS